MEMNEIKDVPLNRPLGIAETWFAQDLTNVCYILEIEGDILPKHIKSACDALSDQFPTLRVNYEKDNKFREVKNYYIDPKIVKTSSSSEWKVIVEDEINTDFDKNGDCPLWAVTVVYHPKDAIKLIITASHGIADGTCSFLFPKNFLEYITMAKNRNLVKPKSMPMLACTEDLIAKTVTLDRKVVDQMIKDKVVNDRLLKPNLYIPVQFEEKNENERYKCAHFHQGTPENYISIKKRAKEENVTIGAILTAAAYFSIESVVQKEQPLSIDIDVNYRDRVDPKLGRNFIACVIGVFDVEFEVHKDTAFWDLVRRIHIKFQDRIKDHAPAYWLEFYRVLEVEKKIDVDHLYANIIERYGRIGDLNLSNIGPYPFETQVGDLNLKSLFCVNGEVPVSYSFLWYIISLDRICYSFISERSLWSRDFADKLFMKMNDLVENSHTFSKELTYADYVNKEYKE
jgi:hypothetical protein